MFLKNIFKLLPNKDASKWFERYIRIEKTGRLPATGFILYNVKVNTAHQKLDLTLIHIVLQKQYLRRCNTRLCPVTLGLIPLVQ